MTSPDQSLVEAVALADWSELLPAHRSDGDDQPRGRARCLDHLPLADGLLLAVVADDLDRTYPVPVVLEKHTGTPHVRRVQAGEGAAEALVVMLGREERVAAPFEVTSWHRGQAVGERGIAVDQTNESIVVGEAAVVKWTVLADQGPHPAPSVLDQLRVADFRGTPLPWAALQWRPLPEAAPRLLALVVSYLPGATDGWTWVVEDIRSAAERDDPSEASETGRRVGELIASFHVALASTARTATGAETVAWRVDAEADLERALETTRGNAHTVLATHADAVRAVLAEIPASAAGPVLRVHGDLHVGQVLRAPGDPAPTYALTDFDGNPVVASGDRLSEQPAALDVAGMAQSFVHAGLVVSRHHPGLDPTVVERMAGAAAAAFLEGYRTGLGDHTDLLDERLFTPFALRQICREFIYAATHLPRWSYVPEAALPMLLRKDRT